MGRERRVERNGRTEGRHENTMKKWKERRKT